MVATCTYAYLEHCIVGEALSAIYLPKAHFFTVTKYTLLWIQNIIFVIKCQSLIISTYNAENYTVLIYALEMMHKVLKSYPSKQ